MTPILHIHGLLQSAPEPDAALMGLASYIADYITEEQARGNTIDKWVIANAIEAYEGGAR
jgi:hypothetical protein